MNVIKRPIYNEELTINTWGRDSNRIFTYRDYEIYKQKLKNEEIGYIKNTVNFKLLEEKLKEWNKSL